MTDISNIIMYGCFIVAFLIWVKVSIKSAAKEELSQIRLDFNAAIDKLSNDIMNRLEAVKVHCMNTTNENAQQVMAMIVEMENDIKNLKK